ISPGLSGMRTTAEIAPPEGKSIDHRETQSQPPLVVEPEPAAVQPRIESAGEFVRRADPLVWPIRWLSVERMITPWLPVIVLAWCGGVLLFALRPLASWLAIRQLRSRGISGVSPVIAETLARIAKRLQLRRAVRIVQSTLVRAPLVIGWLRPLILLPVSVVCELPAEQLDAILAHELAHIRRHDFPINVLQTLIETIFFYHPAV